MGEERQAAEDPAHGLSRRSHRLAGIPRLSRTVLTAGVEERTTRTTYRSLGLPGRGDDWGRVHLSLAGAADEDAPPRSVPGGRTSPPSCAGPNALARGRESEHLDLDALVSQIMINTHPF